MLIRITLLYHFLYHFCIRFVSFAVSLFVSEFVSLDSLLQDAGEALGHFPESAPADNAVGHSRYQCDAPEVGPEIADVPNYTFSSEPVVCKGKMTYLCANEFVNMQAIAAAIASGEYHGHIHQGRSIDSWLRSFLTRATRLPEDCNFGEIEAWYWEGANPLDLPARLHSGYKAAPAGRLRLAPNENLVPSETRVVSSYDMPPAIQELLLTGTDTVDIKVITPDFMTELAATLDDADVKKFKGPNPRKRHLELLCEVEDRKLMGKLHEFLEHAYGFHGNRILAKPCTAEAILTATGLTVEVKSMPKDLHEWGERWNVDVESWDLSDSIVERVLNHPLGHALRSVADGSKFVDHDAWARLLLLIMREKTGFPEYVRERDDAENQVIQYWDSLQMKWCAAGGGRFLRSEAATTFRSYLADTAPSELADISSMFGTDRFLNPVIEMTKALMPIQSDVGIGELDAERSRGKLRFSCGTVVDFATDEVRAGRPEDRITFSTGYAFQEYKGQDANIIKAIVKDFSKHVADGGTSLVETTLGKNLNYYLKKEPKGLYATIYMLFECHDTAMWILRQLCRGLSGFRLLEEFLFLYDERGTNGKGTLLMLLRSALGMYYTTMPYKGGILDTSSGGNNPRLDKARGRRLVSSNETFASGDKNVTFNPQIMKQLIGLDDPMETMGKYKAPQEWDGQALVILSSNVLPVMPKEDGGLRSRVALVRMPFTFCAEPKGPYERQLDASIKIERIPNLKHELIFWAKCFNYELNRTRPDSRILQPRPVKVQMDTDELFVSDDVETAPDHIKTFLAECTLVPAYAAAKDAKVPSSTAEVERAFKLHCGHVVQNPVELLRHSVLYVTPVDKKKLFHVGGTSVRSYYKVKDVPKKPFETGIIVKKKTIAEV